MWRNPIQRDAAQRRWRTTTYSPSIVATSVKVLEESATPDMQVTFTPGSFTGSFKGGRIGELKETPGLSAGAWQMRPSSRGYVEAKSNPPGAAAVRRARRAAKGRTPRRPASAQALDETFALSA